MDASELPTKNANGTHAAAILNAISSEIAGIYKDQFGRRSGKISTSWVGPDMLLVALNDTLTPAERKLQQMGDDQRVRDLRILVQGAGTGALCEPVERLTGRKVRASMSGIDAKADLATELFILVPAHLAEVHPRPALPE